MHALYAFHRHLGKFRVKSNGAIQKLTPLLNQRPHIHAFLPL